MQVPVHLRADPLLLSLQPRVTDKLRANLVLQLSVLSCLALPLQVVLPSISAVLFWLRTELHKLIATTA